VKSAAGLLLVLASLAVLGCGSSDELSKSEFVSQANEACREGEQERLEAMEAKARKFNIQPGALAPPSQQEQIVLAAMDSYEKTTEELKELAPSSEAEEIDPIIEAREETAEEVREDPRTAAHSATQFKKSEELTQKYGLKC
jgi:hypothetical protein